MKKIIKNNMLAVALALTSLSAVNASLTEEASNALLSVDLGEAIVVPTAFPGADLQTAIVNANAQILAAPTGDIAVDLTTVSALVLTAPTGVLDTDINTLSAKLANAPTGVAETDFDALLARLNVHDAAGWALSAAGAGAVANGGAFTTLEQFVAYLETL